MVGNLGVDDEVSHHKDINTAGILSAFFFKGRAGYKNYIGTDLGSLYKMAPPWLMLMSERDYVAHQKVQCKPYLVYLCIKP